MLLIECLVHGEGPDPHENDVRMELHGNEETRDGTRKRPLTLRPDGLWEWRLPASLVGIVEIT